MVSLFLVLFFAFFLFFTVKLLKVSKKKCCNGSDEEIVTFTFYIIMVIIFSILTIIFFIWTFSLINTVGTGATIDQKIAMYQEENFAIEESIDVTVKSYMDFEASTYIELKDKEVINLVSLFPELKSDTLIQQQIEVYVSNNKKIKELKEAKIDLSKAKWKLYFGR